ncbi:FAD-binding oxidoreductase [Variovorax paradoxus]|uniref:FAD-binding oxidoreductase n=1 Tax=Variovorax paradoxus TaxID=34073 RepID=UPI00193465E1|nr:FAD-binding oxidoreductase [Variovorax paradoxus]
MKALLDRLQSLLGDKGLLTGEAMATYELGARYGKGRALAVLRPASATELREAVRAAFEHGVVLVPQGANTGLVGASSPDGSGRQFIVSTERMRSVCEIDPDNRSVRVAAGMRLSELNERLAPHGLWFPIDIGADPSIGGMVAANTGGTRLIRYGDVRHNLLALEVVLCQLGAPLLRLGSALRKDNTGPNLRELFVGSSGVGGLITEVTVEVVPRPQQSATALVVPKSDASVMELLRAIESELGDFLAAFEGLSEHALQAAINHVPSLRNPFAPGPLPEFALLIELESSSSAAAIGLDLQACLDRFLENQFDRTISNAVLGSGASLWHIRHAISDGARALGEPIAFDVSLPRSKLMIFRRAALEFVANSFPALIVIDFGHIADGGMHFNVVRPHETPPLDVAQITKLRDTIYSLVVEVFGGSYSAEHGIGPHNLVYYQRYEDVESQVLAQGIRALLDPHALCGAVDFGPAVPTQAQ